MSFGRPRVGHLPGLLEGSDVRQVRFPVELAEFETLRTIPSYQAEEGHAGFLSSM